MNLLLEFEKRYNGDASETMAICEGIAKDFGMDVDFVADHVYINRYEKDVDDIEMEE